MNAFALIIGWLTIAAALAVVLYFAWHLLIAPILYVACIYLFHWPGFIKGKPFSFGAIARDLWRDYIDAIDYRASWLIVLRLKAPPEGRSA